MASIFFGATPFTRTNVDLLSIAPWGTHVSEIRIKRHDCHSWKLPSAKWWLLFPLGDGLNLKKILFFATLYDTYFETGLALSQHSECWWPDILAPGHQHILCWSTINYISLGFWLLTGEYSVSRLTGACSLDRSGTSTCHIMLWHSAEIRSLVVFVDGCNTFHMA